MLFCGLCFNLFSELRIDKERIMKQNDCNSQYVYVLKGVASNYKGNSSHAETHLCIYYFCDKSECIRAKKENEKWLWVPDNGKYGSCDCTQEKNPRNTGSSSGNNRNSDTNSKTPSLEYVTSTYRPIHVNYDIDVEAIYSQNGNNELLFASNIKKPAQEVSVNNSTQNETTTRNNLMSHLQQARNAIPQNTTDDGSYNIFKERGAEVGVNMADFFSVDEWTRNTNITSEEWDEKFDKYTEAIDEAKRKEREKRIDDFETALILVGIDMTEYAANLGLAAITAPMGPAGSFLASTIGGGLISGFAEAGRQYVDGGSIKWNDVRDKAVIGATSGASFGVEGITGKVLDGTKNVFITIVTQEGTYKDKADAGRVNTIEEVSTNLMTSMFE